MTDTEVYGEAIGTAIHGASTFGKAECAKAMSVISALVKQGRCDDATADRVRSEIGNHSAIRQHCEKHGLLGADKDAKTIAVEAVMDRIGTALTASIKDAIAAKPTNK